MNIHLSDEKEAVRILNSDKDKGLTASEAEKRLKTFGKNIIGTEKKPSFFKRLIKELSDFMTITLLISAVVSFTLSRINGETDFTDPVIILAIVVLNAFIGLFQEYRAENAIDALKKLSAPKAHVLRDGSIVQIPSCDVTVGDILCLKSGDMVSADARIIQCSALTVNEAPLTGESEPVSKESAPQNADGVETGNLLFASTLITGGNARAVVFAVGGETRVGKLADIISDTEENKSPLSMRLASVGKILALGALLFCFLIFLIGLFRHYDPFFMFMTSVSLAVAAIPEGLYAIVTVMLSLGVSRMAAKNAVIRRLTAVETLGCATVICTDKTGTLTKGEMSVTDGIYNKKTALTLAALCSDENGGGTEKALRDGADTALFSEKYPRADEIPFSSERKCMSTLNRAGGGYFTVTKGAFDVVLPKCTHVEKDGVKVPLTDAERAKILSLCQSAASRGLRVIAVAAKRCGRALTEDKLCFIGALYLQDPLRPEAKASVAACRRAGISVIMITGDHKDTALHIASELGITGDVVTGSELSVMSDEELSDRLDKTRIFARVLPEHKLRIVNSLKKKGHVVAMTGDGVNDAPALKAADIGCAMGKSGTDVARCSADMILTDDNFSTITDAVCEGRLIYSGIKKSIHFLISSNIGELLLMFSGIVSGFGMPLLPIQLLWVNLITDSLPAIALGKDRADTEVMLRPPIKRSEGFFSGGVGKVIALEGALIGAVSLAAYSFGLHCRGGEGAARTMAFCTISISQMVHAFCVRSDKSVFLQKNHNKSLLFSAVLGIFLQCAVCTFAPLCALFKTVPLDARQWLATALFSLTPLFCSELYKIDKRRKTVYNL